MEFPWVGRHFFKCEFRWAQALDIWYQRQGLGYHMEVIYQIGEAAWREIVEWFDVINIFSSWSQLTMLLCVVVWTMSRIGPRTELCRTLHMGRTYLELSFRCLTENKHQRGRNWVLIGAASVKRVYWLCQKDRNKRPAGGFLRSYVTKKVWVVVWRGWSFLWW